MKKKLLFGFMAVMLVAGTILAGCVAPAPEVKEPIKIGVLEPLTGPFTTLGIPAVTAMEIAADEINAGGGILGRPVELIARDSKMNPEVALREAKDYITVQNCTFIAGPLSSASGLAVSGYIKELNGRAILLLVGSQAPTITEEKGHRYVFRFIYNSTNWSRSLAIGSAIMYGDTARRIASINPDYAFGHQFQEGFLNHWAKTVPEAKVVYEGWPPVGCTDFTAYITAIMASNPDIVQTCLSGGDAIIFLKQAEPFGLLDEVPVINAEFGSNAALGEMRKGDAGVPIGAVGANTYAFYAIDNPKNNKFYPEVHKRCGMYPEVAATGGYHAVYFLKAAIEKAGSAEDIDGIVDALEGLTLNPLGFADVTIRPCDHQLMLPIFAGVIGWDPTGKFPMPILLPDTIEVLDDYDIMFHSCEEIKASREAAGNPYWYE